MQNVEYFDIKNDNKIFENDQLIYLKLEVKLSGYSCHTLKNSMQHNVF